MRKLELPASDPILDALLDLPPKKLHAEILDVIVTGYDASSFPTGTLVVSRGSCLTILYHSNDMHCHCSILVWVRYDGSDEITLRYEAGRSKPMLFELDTYLYEKGDYVILNELGAVIRSNEHAYVPRVEVLTHPRYLEVVSRLVRILPLTHLSNDTDYGFMHKWQPNYWRHPETVGFANVKEYYHDLLAEDNPLSSAMQQRRRISSTCVDLIMSFVSLLHEELFMQLTSQEVELGLVAASEGILINTDDYDVSRLIRPTSELFKIYQPETTVFLKGIHSHPRKWDLTIFFSPLIFLSLVFCLVVVFLKPMSYVFFGKEAIFGKEFFVKR